MFCDICKEIVINDEVVTGCRHVFHETCLSQWLLTHSYCPTCDYEIADDDSQYIHLCLDDSRSILLVLPVGDVTVFVTRKRHE